MTARDTAVVLVAAGRGLRLGLGKPKAYVDLAGQPLLRHAASEIVKLDRLSQLIVAHPEGAEAESRELLQGLVPSEVKVSFVVGGETRAESIANAIAVLGAAKIVLVHDAARALAPVSLFQRVIDAVSEGKSAVIPALEVVDTIKRVADGLVIENVNRDELRAAQTPQGFERSLLESAYKSGDLTQTDDAALVQSLGQKVWFVSGDEAAFKITSPQDLAAAELRFGGDVRTGIGTDTHRFSADPAKPLYLGTVLWPEEPGLDGHSDGDAVSHAVVDALLSAAGLGDIGSNFGIDRPEFAGANGKVFLEGALDLLKRHSFQVKNVAVQIIGNRPKVSPNRAAVEKAMSEILKAPVSLGATTTDGLGFLGNSEGVAAVATALIAKFPAVAEDRLSS